MSGGQPTIEQVEETTEHEAPQGYKRPSTGTEPTVKTDIKKAGRDFAKREADRIAKVKKNTEAKPMTDAAEKKRLQDKALAHYREFQKRQNG